MGQHAELCSNDLMDGSGGLTAASAYVGMSQRQCVADNGAVGCMYAVMTMQVTMRRR